MQNKRNGFTLIELLVVVLIIGILAAVALPQYQKAVAKSRATEIMTVMGTMIQAVDVAILANGGIPSQLQWNDLDVQIPSLKYSRDYNLSCNGSRCHMYFDDTSSPHDWSLSAYRYSNDDTWHKYCWYGTNLGLGVCKGLESAGFSIRDGSGSGSGS